MIGQWEQRPPGTRAVRHLRSVQHGSSVTAHALPPGSEATHFEARRQVHPFAFSCGAGYSDRADLASKPRRLPSPERGLRACRPRRRAGRPGHRSRTSRWLEGPNDPCPGGLGAGASPIVGEGQSRPDITVPGLERPGSRGADNRGRIWRAQGRHGSVRGRRRLHGPGGANGYGGLARPHRADPQPRGRGGGASGRDRRTTSRRRARHPGVGARWLAARRDRGGAVVVRRRSCATASATVPDSLGCRLGEDRQTRPEPPVTSVAGSRPGVRSGPMGEREGAHSG